MVNHIATISIEMANLEASTFSDNFLNIFIYVNP